MNKYLTGSYLQPVRNLLHCYEARVYGTSGFLRCAALCVILYSQKEDLERRKSSFSLRDNATLLVADARKYFSDSVRLNLFRSKLRTSTCFSPVGDDRSCDIFRVVQG